MSPIVASRASGSAQGYGGLRTFAPETAFESIATVNASGSSNTITFNSIPGTYKHLHIRMLVKSTTNVNDAGDASWQVRCNGDTGTNYSHHYILGNGSTASAGGNSTRAQAILGNSTVPGSGSSLTNIFNASYLDIHDYASTSKYKTMKVFTGTSANGVSGEAVSISSGLWQSTSAITSITIFTQSPNFTSTSTFALYGIKG